MKIPRVNGKELLGLLGIMAAVILLWSTPLVYPLKVLVVVFHELSHGLAAILTGGSIEDIGISADEGGYCHTRGGIRFAVISAGYLGSLLWGGLLLVVAARTRHDRLITGFLGVLLVAVSAFFVRPVAGFGFAFGLAAGAALVAASSRLSHASNDFILKVIGLTSCLYAILDIKDDVLDRPGARSDARLLAEHTGLPTLFWGLLWIVVAIVAAVYFVVLATRRGSGR